MLHQRLSNDRLLLRRQVVSLMLQNLMRRNADLRSTPTLPQMSWVSTLGRVQRHGRVHAQRLSTAGSARVVENEQGMRATPSLVAFTESGDILVGQPAKKLLFARGATPVTGFSQMLGLRFDSQEFVELRDAGAFGKLEVIADTRERDISDDVDAAAAPPRSVCTV